MYIVFTILYLCRGMVSVVVIVEVTEVTNKECILVVAFVFSVTNKKVINACRTRVGRAAVL